MTDLQTGIVILSMLGLAIGFRFLKFEKGNKQETVVYGRDIVALLLIALSIAGAFVGLTPIQTNGAANAGFSTNRCQDATNTLCYLTGSTGLVDNDTKALRHAIAFLNNNAFNAQTSLSTWVSTGQGATIASISNTTFWLVGYVGLYQSSGTNPNAVNVEVCQSTTGIPALGSAACGNGGPGFQLTTLVCSVGNDSNDHLCPVDINNAGIFSQQLTVGQTVYFYYAIKSNGIYQVTNDFAYMQVTEYG